MKCLICGSSHLGKLENPKYGLMVAGNRNSFEESKGIEKRICEDCGHIQAFHNTTYAESVQKIFNNYGALGNKSFGSGKPVLREHIIMEKLIKALQLPKKGKFLDIGCGSGEAMHFFHSKMPEWEVYGMDIDESFREQVVKRAGGGITYLFQKFMTVERNMI